MLILYLLGLFHPTIDTSPAWKHHLDPFHCAMYRGNGQPDEEWDEGFDGPGHLYCVVIN